MSRALRPGPFNRGPFDGVPPHENAPAAEVPWVATVGVAAKKRTNLTRRHGLLPSMPADTPLAASSSRQVDEPFRTNVQRGRRSVVATWLAAMAPAVVAVPVAAWLARPALKRHEVRRQVVTPAPLQWQYIAPTIAAVLPRAKVVRVDFMRRPVSVRPLLFSAPPTGPPLVAMVALRANRVSHSKSLVAAPAQPIYPATHNDQGASLVEPFTTAQTRSRRSLTIGWHAGLLFNTPIVPVAAVQAARGAKRRKSRPGLFLGGGSGAVFPSSTPALYPSYLPPRTFSSSFERKLRTLAAPIGVPAAEPTDEATHSLAAPFVTAIARSRRFVSVPSLAHLATPPISPALYPSFLPLRAHTTSFVRTLRDLPPPVGIDAAEPTDQGTHSLAAPFTTTTTRGRRLIVATWGAHLAAPAPAPVPYPATAVQRVRRRRGRPGLFLSGSPIDGFAAAAQPESAYRAQRARRVEFERSLILAPALCTYPPTPRQPETAFRLVVARRVDFDRGLISLQALRVYPPTPAVPPQPESALRLKTVLRSSQRRTLLPQFALLEFPPSPPTPVTPASGIGGYFYEYEFIVRERRRRKREQEELERQLERIPDQVEQEIARLLHEQLERETRRRDATRLQALIDEDARRKRVDAIAAELSERAAEALRLALIERTFSAIERLERELDRMLEEEDIAVLQWLLEED